MRKIFDSDSKRTEDSIRLSKDIDVCVSFRTVIAFRFLYKVVYLSILPLRM